MLQKIAAASTWELPQDMLRKQARKTLARKVMEMRNAGISDEQIQGRRRLLEQDVLKSTADALKEQEETPELTMVKAYTSDAGTRHLVETTTPTDARTDAPDLAP